jgi:hypothetical protein
MIDGRTHWEGCAAVHLDCAALALVSDEPPYAACATPGCACLCPDIDPDDVPCLACDVNGCKTTEDR